MLITKTKAELEKEIKKYRLWIIWGFVLFSITIISSFIMGSSLIFFTSIIILLFIIGFKIEEQTSLIRYELKGGF